MTRQIFILLLGACFNAKAQPANDDSGAVGYRDIVSQMHLDAAVRADALAMRHLKFKLKMTPRNPDIKPSTLVITINTNGNQSVFPANSFGAFDIPLTMDLYRMNPRIEINRGYRDGLSVGIELQIMANKGEPLSSKMISDALNEYDTAVKKGGILARMFAPTLKSLVLRSSFPLTRCSIANGRNIIVQPAPQRSGEFFIPLSMLQHGDGLLKCDAPVDTYLFDTLH